MSVVVFSGPTLAPNAVLDCFPEASCLGPAARGDVLRAARKSPAAICIIDGYFEHVPSVSHKEILWALSAGIPVYGAASMGALRAAELSTYGMTGHGVIFEVYNQRLLEDDDEVAVAHEDAAHGYRGRTEALVNLRATLHQAVANERLALASARAILHDAKRLFYAERSKQAYHALIRKHLQLAHGAPSPGWFERDWIDQKELDCRSLLRRVRREYLADRWARSPGRGFVRTSFWDALLSDVAREDAQRHAEDVRLVVDQLRQLGPNALTACEFAATRRALCRALAQLAGAADPEQDLDRAMQLAAEAAHRELPAILRLLPRYDQLLAQARQRSQS